MLTARVALVAFVLLCLAQTAKAQEPSMPKPGPEQKLLEVWAGKWRYEGAEVETPLGIKGNFKGKSENRILAGGFALELHDVEKTGDWLSVMWFDASTKTYRSKSFQPSGMVNSALVTVSGNTWSTLGELSDKNGKVWKTRSSTTFSTDGKSTTGKQEYSADDGNTWLLWWTFSSKKTGK